MLCLVMKPASLDLDVLFGILKDRRVDVELSSRLGAGTDLARAAIGGFDCGIAVIPSGTEGNSGARAALFVEIGIAVAHRIPLLVIVDPQEPPLPGLSDLMTVRASEDNRTALALHLGLFLARLDRQKLHSDLWNFYGSQRAHRPRVAFGPTEAGTTAKVESLISDLIANQSLWSQKIPRHENDLTQLLDALLTAHGATVQREVRTINDARVDIAFTYPSFGETVLVELTDPSRGDKTLTGALQQLSSFVRMSHQSIGLLLYDGPTDLEVPATSPAHPLVWTMSLTDFYRKVLDNDLVTFLAQARNQLVHG